MSRPCGFPIALFAAVLLIAGSASAVSTVYDMTGTTMRMFNQLCGPCTVGVTGTVTLDDDGAGNVALTDLSLAHAGYQVGSPSLISVVIERTSILLGAGSVAGTGSTLSSVTFGSTTIAQTGTATCAPATFGCAAANLPEGPTPLPETLTVDLGDWTFDALGGFSANFTYQSVTSPPAIEYLRLVGTPVPEPGTGALLAIGVAVLGWSRRRSE